jgi:hypothetical protein
VFQRQNAEALPLSPWSPGPEDAARGLRGRSNASLGGKGPCPSVPSRPTVGVQTRDTHGMRFRDVPGIHLYLSGDPTCPWKRRSASGLPQTSRVPSSASPAREPPPRRPQLGAAPLLPTAGTSGMKGRRKGTAGRAVSSFLVSSGRPAGRRALTSSESPGRRRTPRLRSATPPPPPPTPFVVTGSHSNRRRPTPVAPPPSRSVSAPPPYWPRPL